MAGDPLSTVIGVFPDYDQANKAIDELRRTKFSYDRIRLVQHGTGNFFDNLKGMFTGQASMTSDTADVLVKMGMPEYEAQHYQQELNANHVLLLMNADDRPEEAFSIMRQNGAFDLNSRLRTSPSDGTAETPHPNGEQKAVNTPPEAAQPDNSTSKPRSDTPPEVAQPDNSTSTSQSDTPPVISSPDIAPPASSPAVSSSRYNSDVSQESARNS